MTILASLTLGSTLTPRGLLRCERLYGSDDLYRAVPVEVACVPVSNPNLALHHTSEIEGAVHKGSVWVLLLPRNNLNDPR